MILEDNRIEQDIVCKRSLKSIQRQYYMFQQDKPETRQIHRCNSNQAYREPEKTNQ